MEKKIVLSCLVILLALFGTINVSAQGKKDSLPASMNKDSINNELDEMLLGVAADEIDSLDSIPPKKRSFRFGIKFGNNYSYQGRTDATPAPYIAPSFRYKAKSGFWTQVDAYHIWNLPVSPEPGAKNQDTLTNGWASKGISAGWDFNITDALDAGISYGYTKYSRNNDFLKYAMANDLMGSIGYDFDFLYTSLGIDYNFGNVPYQITSPNGRKKNTKKIFMQDYYLDWDVSHEFYWEDLFTSNDGLSIEPTFSLSAGTNNFYARLAKIKKANQQIDPEDISDATLKVRAIYLSLPITFQIKGFTIAPEYSYTILLNQPAGYEIPNYSLFKITFSYKIRSVK